MRCSPPCTQSTLLLIAVIKYGSQGGRHAVVLTKCLRSRDAMVAVNSHGATDPLPLVDKSNFEYAFTIVQALLLKGISPYESDERANTALHLAAANSKRCAAVDNLRVCRLLLLLAQLRHRHRSLLTATSLAAAAISGAADTVTTATEALADAPERGSPFEALLAAGRGRGPPSALAIRRCGARRRGAAHALAAGD